MIETRRYHTLIQLHRIVYLFFGVGTSGLGAISYLITKNVSSLYTTLIPLSLLLLIAYGFYNRYSINIFKRNITVAYNARTERELVYTLAFGLYGIVVATLLYVCAFIFLKELGLSEAVTTGIILVNLAVFCVIGYFGSIQLRKNMNWLIPNKTI
ncbi:MAG: hypothetical protein LBQ98_01685 [Nitrososphaerota archaeon]|jgi:hypothetical protein|nr:hypothetical protein [Nitrososphaerota archaeon]